MEAGITMIEKAISLDPNAASFHHNIAGMYRRSGRLAEAVSEFKKAIQLKRDYAEAYQGLADMVTFDAKDDFYPRILKLLESR
jgi:tetratricopeptide (TPR) repeat protein